MANATEKVILTRNALLLASLSKQLKCHASFMRSLLNQYKRIVKVSDPQNNQSTLEKADHDSGISDTFVDEYGRVKNIQQDKGRRIGSN